VAGRAPGIKYFVVHGWAFSCVIFVAAAGLLVADSTVTFVTFRVKMYLR